MIRLCCHTIVQITIYLFGCISPKKNPVAQTMTDTPLSYPNPSYCYEWSHMPDLILLPKEDKERWGTVMIIHINFTHTIRVIWQSTGEYHIHYCFLCHWQFPCFSFHKGIRSNLSLVYIKVVDKIIA